MHNDTPRNVGFLTRLARNSAGNTLAITAAAVIPLIALVGGGIDLSRLYLSKSRLQQACDAGALAGRKAMSGITWTSDNEATANNFFHMNFPDKKFGSGTMSIKYTASGTGAVTGTASVVMPMTLMGIFNYGEKTISANCTADLQLPNTDVMFVLDTTLSMSDTNPSDSQSKIAILRSSVKSFYDQLQLVKPAGSHIRYGFVPYSSTVNVGMLLKRDWIQDNPEYDTREPDSYYSWDTNPQGDTSNTYDAWQPVSGSQTTGTKYTIPAEKCVAPPNDNYSDSSSYTAWNPPAPAVPRERTRTRTRKGTTFSVSLSSGVCTVTPTIYNNLVETQIERVIKNPNAGQTSKSYAYHWTYKRLPYSVVDLKGTGDGNATVSGGSIFAPVTNDYGKNDIPGLAAKDIIKKTEVKWNQTNACIEERATRRSDDLNTVPAYDLDIDLVPDRTKPATQWKPFLPKLVYGRRGGNATTTTNWEYSDQETSTRLVSPTSTNNYYTTGSDTTQYGACPTFARKLAEIDASTLSTYLAGLTPAGFTYHDIGMMWGLRLMSPQGLFAAEHQAAEASGKVARHLIFMTDGDTDTRITAYDAWGMSAVARRRTPKGAIPTNAQQNAITEQRLSDLCTVAKNDKNITVWVIAFGTKLTTLLSNCASPNRAYQANNAAELTKTFSDIASQIASLRITK